MMNPKRLSLFLLLLAGCCLPLVAQALFTPPFDFPIAFAGNFGELRSNHFHGGLDFKTQGAVGKPVRALADGYISRIRVTHGSGYVLDVVYHNGYTTINRHLDGFVGEMARRVEELQYREESWEVEIVPQADEYPVKAGEVIALSGNTGYSFGPHLHLDVFETATGDYIDPLPFFAPLVNDHTAPRAEGILLVPREGKGTVMGGTQARTFPAHPKQTLTAWGWIGAGIKAHDYMDGVHNRYGVHTVTLRVDSQEVFRSVVDRFAYEENRYINSWNQGGYMRSFIEPGNRLRMLHDLNGARGWVLIDEERPYHFEYTLSDALGNTSRLRFTVQGKACDIPAVEWDDRYLFRWNQTNVLQEPGLRLVVPKGMLYDDVPLRYAVRTDSGDVAFTYQLHDCKVPLHAGCELRIGLRHRPLADSTKYYVAAVTSSGNRHSVGGRYDRGEMVAQIRELGTYTVAIDTVPPVITPVGRAQWARQGRIEFKARDAATGIASYRGTIDGQYALFGKPNAVSGTMVCRLDPSRVKRGGKHHLCFTVTDGCGNQSTYETDFIY